MKKYNEKKSYTEIIVFRTRIYWGILILLFIYMIVIGEMGMGDSRMMTPLAQNISRIIFFGGGAYVIYRIVHNKKLLINKQSLVEQKRKEEEEREQFLYDKSGGIVVNILLCILLFVTCTAALSNMVAFYVSFGILGATILLKIGSYIFYSKRY